MSPAREAAAACGLPFADAPPRLPPRDLLAPLPMQYARRHLVLPLAVGPRPGIGSTCRIITQLLRHRRRPLPLPRPYRVSQPKRASAIIGIRGDRDESRLLTGVRSVEMRHAPTPGSKATTKRCRTWPSLAREDLGQSGNWYLIKMRTTDMKKNTLFVRAVLIMTALLILILPLRAGAQGPYKPSWNSLKNVRTPQWLRDGKFGIYTHWGVYAVPAQGPNATWYANRSTRTPTDRNENIMKPPTASWKISVTKISFPCLPAKSSMQMSGRNCSKSGCPICRSGR